MLYQISQAFKPDPFIEAFMKISSTDWTEYVEICDQSAVPSKLAVQRAGSVCSSPACVLHATCSLHCCVYSSAVYSPE